MKATFHLVAMLALIAPVSASATTAAVEQVCFTPGGQCTDVITSEIAKSKSEILVQAYSFTSAPIAKALVEAKQRGVNVRVVLDKSQLSERYTGATFLKNAGVPVRIDAAHAIAHNKIIIIDGVKVLTGSFNFTKAAQEKNAENLVVLSGADLAKNYMANFELHASHSKPLD